MTAASLQAKQWNVFHLGNLKKCIVMGFYIRSNNIQYPFMYFRITFHSVKPNTWVLMTNHFCELRNYINFLIRKWKFVLLYAKLNLDVTEIGTQLEEGHLQSNKIGPVAISTVLVSHSISDELLFTWRCSLSSSMIVMGSIKTLSNLEPSILEGSRTLRMLECREW